MCLSYCSFYLEMVKQLQPCKRNAKECLKDEQGWFGSLRIKLSIRISVAELVSKEMDEL